MEHLAYCEYKAKELEKLLSGQKTMLIRGATGRKLPYGRVFPGEIIFLIENDGKGIIQAKGVVSQVINSEKLSPETAMQLIVSKMDNLNLTKEQVDRWSKKRYLCLIEIQNIERIDPFSYHRAGNMDDWIIVNSIDEIKKEISK